MLRPVEVLMACTGCGPLCHVTTWSSFQKRPLTVLLFGRIAGHGHLSTAVQLGLRRSTSLVEHMTTNMARFDPLITGWTVLPMTGNAQSCQIPGVIRTSARDPDLYGVWSMILEPHQTETPANRCTSLAPAGRGTGECLRQEMLFWVPRPDVDGDPLSFMELTSLSYKMN